MKYLLMLLMTFLLCIGDGLPVYAQGKKIPDKPKVAKKVVKPAPIAITASADDAGMAKDAAAKTIKDTKDPAAANKEVIDATFATVEEANKYFAKRKDGTKTAFMWAALVAAILKLFIALIRRISPLFKKTRGKWIIRFVTLAAGAGVAILANIVGGMSWLDAVIVFFGGPGAILITEYQKMIPFLRPKKE